MPRATWTVRLGDVRLPIWRSAPTGRAAKRALVLAPGAGTAATHPWLEAQAGALRARGLTVFRFDFAYRAAGRKAPDRLPKLVEAYRAVIARIAEDGWRPGQLWLGGKSMGGRVASHAVAEGLACAGLVFYGYPIAPNGTFTPMRTAHWPAITVPALFLTGSRDRLCPLDRLTRERRRWGARSSSHVIPDADHSFAVPKRSGRSAENIHVELASTVAEWIRAAKRR